ncbi:hypothetical protein QBC38DRAFT_439797 [Podospora fimiseda]|uniref:Granulins domain-containing protein n=1 Tax=Podospora fimiseda TaxID=252190 RepID=A0AAN7H809_9PEZI|nr:hypothetical protein QBC38DRAFT_439797 [Podospora fimiseda]
MRHSKTAVISCLVVLAAGMMGTEGQQTQKSLGQISSAPSTEKDHRFMSCEETYGEDWIVCGGARSSRSCFNPTMGQSCCAVDNGYCEEGTWCAPVAGYCCLDSEDLETCAKNAGFELPADLLESDESKTKHSWTMQLKEPARTRGHSSLKRRERPDESESLRPAAAGRIDARESTAPGRDRLTLVWMCLGIGAVGLVVLSC